MSQGVPVANQEDIRPEDAQEGDALIPQDARSSNKSLQSSEGVVIENLDGTIQHGTAGGASANQTQNLSGRARFPNYPQNRVVFVVDDDEIAVYSGFYELPSRIDEFLDLLFRHQRNFIIFLFTITLLAVFLCWRAYEYRDNGVTTLGIEHPNTSKETLEKLYIWAIILELVYSVWYLIFGCWAACKRSVTLFNGFNTVCLIGMILELLMAFVNRYEVSLFLLRFFGFLYARFLNQLITSLLLLPR